MEETVPGISATKKQMAAALDRLKPAVGRRAMHPVLNAVRIEGDTFAGTDLELFIETACEGAVTAGDLRCAVPFKPLAAAVSSFAADEVLTLTASRDEATLRAADGSTITLATLVLEDFPSFEMADATLVGTIEGAALTTALNHVLPAVSTDEVVRPILTGVLVEYEGDGVMRFTATDSYRLAIDEAPASFNGTAKEGSSWIVPGSALRVLTKAKPAGPVEVTISADGARISLAFGRSRYISRIIDGQFPKYRSLIPDPRDATGRLTIDGKDLALTLARATKVFAGSSQPVVKLELNGKVRLTRSETGFGDFSRYLKATWDGGEMVIGFNPDYLQDVVAVCGDNIDGRIFSPLKPGYFTPEGASFPAYVQMPYRLSR